MTPFLAKPLLLATLTTLAACGGGGDQGDAPSALFFGSTDPDASRNGLDYADGTQTTADLQDQTHTVRVVRLDSVGTGLGVVLNDEVLTIGAPGANGEIDNFVLTLNGEELTFVDGEVELADGTTLESSSGIGFLEIDTDFVTAFELSLKQNLGGGGPIIIGFFDDQAFVTGFETNPDVIENATGSATYAGALDVGLPGSFLFDVNFADGTLGGSVNVASGTVTDFLSLELAPTTITGNGFATDLINPECNFGPCTSNSQIAGVFYGPNAEEVGGVISIDVEPENAGNFPIGGFTGTGVFVGGEI